MEFSRQEYWSGLPFPSPEELPNPGIEPWSPASQADSLLFELQGTPSKSLSHVWLFATPWIVATRLFCPWNSPGYFPGVGCHSLLQGILPTQGSNPGLPRCRQILYQLSHQGSSGRSCILTENLPYLTVGFYELFTENSLKNQLLHLILTY